MLLSRQIALGRKLHCSTNRIALATKPRNRVASLTHSREKETPATGSYVDR
jgi:hypothetical protein